MSPPFVGLLILFIVNNVDDNVDSEEIIDSLKIKPVGNNKQNIRIAEIYSNVGITGGYFPWATFRINESNDDIIKRNFVTGKEEALPSYAIQLKWDHVNFWFNFINDSNETIPGYHIFPENVLFDDVKKIISNSNLAIYKLVKERKSGLIFLEESPSTIIGALNWKVVGYFKRDIFHYVDSSNSDPFITFREIVAIRCKSFYIIDDTTNDLARTNKYNLIILPPSMFINFILTCL